MIYNRLLYFNCKYLDINYMLILYTFYIIQLPSYVTEAASGIYRDMKNHRTNTIFTCDRDSMKSREERRFYYQMIS